MLLIHRAIYFAVQAHDGQKRKGTDIPYIAHPFEVAQLLMEAGAEDVVVAAGLLHDTVEDTAVTAADIQKQFGVRVAELVMLCSEEKGLSWEERKNQMLARVQGAPREAMLIICADKLSNIRSIADEYVDEDFWKRFHRGKAEQAWYYRKMLEALSPLAKMPMYQELKKSISSVFGRIA